MVKVKGLATSFAGNAAHGLNRFDFTKKNII